MTAGRRLAAALITSGALLVALTGCSSGVTINGAEIVDPGNALTGALTKLKEDNNTGIQNGSTTISDATSCFYVKASADADDVTDRIACGPIRRLGQPDDKVWDQYPMEMTQNADGEVTASVGVIGEEGQAQAVNPELLVSTDDSEPAAAADVPEPQAPPSTITDTAMLVGSADGLGSFQSLEKPAKLITPSATIEVTEAAEPEFVPPEMVDDSEVAGGEAPYYRSADGQKLYAFKVKIGPSLEGSKTVLASSADSETYADSNTALTVGLSDGKTLNIRDTTSESAGSSDTATVGCVSEQQGSNFPCGGGESSEIILLMTVPADGTPSLVASVNGDKQSVELSTGELTSSVSQVEYSRTELTTEINKTLKAVPIKVKNDDDTVTANWSVSLESASISAFDAYRGWAPEGQAWLTVGTQDYQTAGDSSGFTLDKLGSVKVSVDGKELKTDGLTDAGIEYESVINLAYLVPEDTTAATVSFQPTGRYAWFDAPVKFTAAKATTYEITLPE